MSLSPVWLLRSVVEAMRDEQIAEHGGAGGLRDAGLLDSALARPQTLLSYGEPGVFDLAAAYAFGIVRNHPFVDGNKRTGFLAAYLFLRLNGRKLVVPQDQAVANVLALVSGEMNEAAFAAWLGANVRA